MVWGGMKGELGVGKKNNDVHHIARHM